MARANNKAPTGWDKFLKLLRWEKRVTMLSDMSCDEALRALQDLADLPGSWRSYLPFASNKPLMGDVAGHRGLLTCRDRAFRRSCLRALKFSVEPTEAGSALNGTLQLRQVFYIYEWAVIAAAVFMEFLPLYGMYVAKSPDYRGITSDMLRPLFFVPFLWCYIRVGMWIGRKREAELLALIQGALTTKPRPATLVKKPSTPTEVFIRPRHSRPDERSS